MEVCISIYPKRNLEEYFDIKRDVILDALCMNAMNSEIS